MRFADITGQEDLKRHLTQSVDAGRVSHAQLFTGTAGSGALAVAVAYVQYLCCRHRSGGDSCGECPDCRQIAALAHPDLHLVFPVNKQGKKSGEVMRSDEFLPQFRALFAERGGYFSPQDWYDRLDLGKTLKGMIAAREADEIIRKLSFKSFEADYKTMLIWLPEAMNEEAANKILKILEEPWDRTLFILVCEHPDRLLPTIVSRTQEVCVPRIAPDVLERVAQQRGVADPLQARNMARLAGGDLLELGHLVAGESDAMRKELIRIWQLSKKTIFFITHSVPEAVYLADRVVILKDGRVSLDERIDLPRPRDIRSVAFQDYVDLFSHQIADVAIEEAVIAE